MRHFMSHIRHFGDCQRGGVAMMIGVCMIPIALIIGLAFDSQRARHAANALQTAVDASSLAAARHMQVNVEATKLIKLVAKEYFRADLVSMQGGMVCPDPVVNIDDETFRVEVIANCALPTTFAAIVGQEEWHLTASAGAQSSASHLDLALMLDVSGSMEGERIEALQYAAKEAVNVILDSNTGGGGRIGLAPYASSVNIGGYAVEAADPNDYVDESVDVNDSNWRPNPDCVSERKGKASKKNDPPGPGTYVGYDALECPTSDVVALTSDKDKLHARIDALSAGGNTAGQLGIDWSWYLVSDEWDEFWGHSADDAAVDPSTVLKTNILMTDGEFNKSYDTTQGNSVNQAKVMCKRMREEGIIIYSVAFQAPSEGKSILKDCASSEADTYFEPETAEDLTEVYRTIASQLGRLRLVN